MRRFKFFQTLSNIWKIPELRQRILFTLGLLAVYRLGSYITLPGIDPVLLEAQFDQQQGGGLLGLVNTFVGGAFARGSILALGIMPYISASIILQLGQVAVPALARLRKEGEAGQRKMNQITRYLTVIITAGQSAGYLVNLQSMYGEAISVSDSMFWVTGIFILTAGTMFLVWMGERITDRGIGNGVSLLITIGIVADLPGAIIAEFQLNPTMIFYAEIIALGLMTMSVVALTVAVRKIPINFARRMMGNKMMGGMTPTMRQYIPLKLNAANVMPIIFAQAIMFIPATVAQAFPESDFSINAQNSLSDWHNPWYNLIFGLLIVVFTYFYTSITVNPNDIANDLKQQGGFIPGVKPGKKTSDYIDSVMTRITLPGSLYLAFVAIVPAIVASFGVSDAFALFFGGTSLLIMIGVVLDTIQQINSYLQMRHYDGLMKSGRMKGRSAAVQTGSLQRG